MKRTLLILIWLTYFSGSEKSSKYITNIDLNGVIISIPRENYLEYYEGYFNHENKIDAVNRQFYIDSIAYIKWESMTLIKNKIHNALYFNEK